MSFLPFFFDALKHGESFDVDQYAKYIKDGQALAADCEAGIAKGAAGLDDILRPLVIRSYIDDAIETPRQALYHFARYLALLGEFHGAGRLIEGQSRAKFAKSDTMKASKRLRRDTWKVAALAAGTRLLSKKSGPPRNDTELAEQIHGSREFRALNESLRRGVDSIRAALKELGLSLNKDRSKPVRRRSPPRKPRP